ncbi:TPA: prefoldin subunit beta [Candidatus Poribacteria bacterium]|nr:prefoldin subunit beta [Candidatus Poribacteria bacterium]
MSTRSVDLSKLPPEIQREVLRLQQLQQTLEVTLLQKQQLELRLRETERALKELEKAEEDAAVFKSVGSILIRRDVATVREELEEERDILNIRLKALTRQEERSRERLEGLQKRISKSLKSLGLT